ncbi:hypothetical protein CDIK_3318 [Cucumispora dikerogammari]|nr:hypothetical protein CDIK_3318 [Cucumispora dikerogammari]
MLVLYLTMLEYKSTRNFENNNRVCFFSFKFLSLCSYTLNLIENSFSKIKNSVKASLATGEGRALVELISNEVSTITSEDFGGYFTYMFRNITNSAAEPPYIHQ